jgi:hypothetical protein
MPAGTAAPPAGRPAWWMGAVNGLMAPVTRSGLRPGWSFCALEARASRRAGTPGLADPEFLADLRVLHEAFLGVRELSFTGLAGLRAELLRHMVNRIRVRRYLAVNPQAAAAPVRQPVFVVGLPRTGTTLLHAALASMPGYRAPLLWELLAPCPPDPQQGGADRRERDARRFVSLAYRAAPPMRVIHPLDAAAPEECVFALPHSMCWYTRARLPGYREWYDRRDTTADYAYLRQQLQILQWQQPARRWVLKSPFHLWNTDALLRIFPDATIVWTHRDPTVALASWCSLAEVTMRLHNRRVDPGLIGQDWLQLWAQAVTRATRVRACAAAPFLDVSYTRLAAGPRPVLAEIGRLLGTEPTPAAGQAVAGRASPPGPGGPGVHRYSLARYGLTPAAVRAAFPQLPG